MSDLDRWAREHKHRIWRERIAAVRASRASVWLSSGVIASGQIGFSHLASGLVPSTPKTQPNQFAALFSGLPSPGTINWGTPPTPCIASGSISNGNIGRVG